jgi:UDP-N-acetylmuramyl pentapeptide synthase
VPGRQIAHQLRNGAVLVDDSYNANPGSLAAAIDALAAAPEEGWLVLGDMRELGPDAEALHAQAGSAHALPAQAPVRAGPAQRRRRRRLRRRRPSFRHP